jgi:hypothetical protein
LYKRLLFVALYIILLMMACHDVEFIRDIIEQVSTAVSDSDPRADESASEDVSDNPYTSTDYEVATLERIRGWCFSGYLSKRPLD